MLNGRLVIAATILLFVALELKLPAWPRYRRIVVAGIVFLLNAAVLFGMAVLSTTTMLAAKVLIKSP